MSKLFASAQPIDFGPFYLHRFAVEKLAIQQVTGARSSLLRERVRRLAPKKPGVYGMLNRRGELIYVGKAKQLRSRLLSYFRHRSRPAKARRIVANTNTIVWEAHSDEFAALHRELELIRRWRPRLNVRGQPGSRRPVYVCIGRPPAPYVFLARRPPRRVMTAFGPIPRGSRAREAVRRLNDAFQLRDCPQAQQMHFADQGELFASELSAGCLRYEIGTCLGPCARGCSRAQYFKKVRAARAFLDGQDLAMLQSLQTEIEKTAAQQRYERAAVLRDFLETLSWLNRQLDRLRQLRDQGTVIYPLSGYDERTRWYLIHEGKTLAVLPAPPDQSSRLATAGAIDEIVQRTQLREQMQAHRDNILLVASWFRRYPEEKGKICCIS